jgi:HSP20 family protein
MVYRTTLAPMVSLSREMDRLFDDVFVRGVQTSAWQPKTDVHEEATAYVFELELPGVEPSAVEVTAENGILTVRGEKRSTRQDSESVRWHLVERTAGSFTRVFRLPQSVNEEAIEASFANGVLTVRAAKAELPKPKKIEVRTA